MTITVDDAGAAAPALVDAIAARGGDVVAAREQRPSFDDVFAALVERDAAVRAAPDPRADHGTSDPGTAR
jgi:hypothetical protein